MKRIYSYVQQNHLAIAAAVLSVAMAVMTLVMLFNLRVFLIKANVVGELDDAISKVGVMMFCAPLGWMMSALTTLAVNHLHLQLKINREMLDLTSRVIGTMTEVQEIGDRQDINRMLERNGSRASGEGE